MGRIKPVGEDWCPRKEYLLCLWEPRESYLWDYQSDNSEDGAAYLVYREGVSKVILRRYLTTPIGVNVLGNIVKVLSEKVDWRDTLQTTHWDLSIWGWSRWAANLLRIGHSTTAGIHHYKWKWRRSLLMCSMEQRGQIRWDHSTSRWLRQWFILNAIYT